MDFHLGHVMSGGSPSSSSSSTDRNLNHRHNNGSLHHNSSTTTTGTNTDNMHSWWESISKARSRIQLLSSLLADSAAASISSLADSDRPARSLLSSFAAYSTVSHSLSCSPSSGCGDDPLCHWLYDTFLSADPDLRLVVLSFIPLLSSVYLTRIHSTSSISSSNPTPSLAGFEAVLLALYASETKARAGKPILISIPDLSQPSLYHTPRVQINTNSNKPNPNLYQNNQSRPSVGIICPSLEPQMAVKSTKRACIVGVALDCYFKQISQMPSWSKLDFCKFAAHWAGQDCPCKSEFDKHDEDIEEINVFSDSNGVDIVEEMGHLGIDVDSENRVPRGTRIPLPWELLQPVLRILGHCLLGPLNTDDVKDAASVAVRYLYARASHDLVPQAILATRSLIQLDNRARVDAKASAAANAAPNTNTPSKAKKPEVLLVSK